MLSDDEAFKALMAAGVPAAVGVVGFTAAVLLARPSVGWRRAGLAAAAVLAGLCTLASWAVQFADRWDRWHHGLAAMALLLASWAVLAPAVFAPGAMRHKPGRHRWRAWGLGIGMLVATAAAGTLSAMSVYPTLWAGYRVLAVMGAAAGVAACWPAALRLANRPPPCRPAAAAAASASVAMFATSGVVFLAGFAGAAELLSPAAVLAGVAACTAAVARRSEVAVAAAAGALGLAPLAVPVAVLGWVNSWDLGPAFATAMLLPVAGMLPLAAGASRWWPWAVGLSITCSAAGLALAVSLADLRVYGM